MIGRPLCVLALAGSMALAGCGRHPRPAMSWVAPTASLEARTIAAAITEWLSEVAPPATSTLLPLPVSRRQQGNAVTAALLDDLRAHGYGIATSLEASPDAHVVRYVITPVWDRYLLLRVQIDGVEGSRLFYRDMQGGLSVASPLMERGTQ